MTLSHSQDTHATAQSNIRLRELGLYTRAPFCYDLLA
jgi:hypothetical protein